MEDLGDVDLAAIDLKLLAILDAVLVEGNLSRAGRRLGLTQSAVSQAIARLRVILGDELFVRTGRGVRATARAQSLAVPIARALALLRAALAPASAFDPAASDRRFFISMRQDLAHVLGARLHGVLPAGSRVSFYIVDRAPTDLAAALRYGAPELALTTTEISGAEIRSTLLVAERLVVLARRGNPAVGERLTEEAYLRLGHVLLSRADPADASEVDARLAGRGRGRHVSLALPSASAVVAVAASTDNLCTAPERMWRPFAEGLDIVAHEPPLDLPHFNVHMSWHERLEDDAGHRWLRRTLLQLCDEL